jgi:hypothetical protein
MILLRWLALASVTYIAVAVLTTLAFVLLKLDARRLDEKQRFANAHQKDEWPL